MTTTDKPTGLALLREPFPASQISQLPRVNCFDCSKRENRGECAKHKKSRCKICGAWISSAHIHLDYVGHAALTDRLLSADPMWSWEPLAFGPDGLPAFDAVGGLWIRLTVCGHTRLGYGDAQGKQGPNAVKEAIGDALRNAAMRFGAALDLWHKGELHADDATEQKIEHERLVHDIVTDEKKATRSWGKASGDDDPWATLPATDVDWYEGWRLRVTDCTDIDALRLLWSEMQDKHRQGHLSDQDYADAETICTERSTELKQDGAA